MEHHLYGCVECGASEAGACTCDTCHAPDCYGECIGQLDYYDELIASLGGPLVLVDEEPRDSWRGAETIVPCGEREHGPQGRRLQAVSHG